MKAQIKDTIDLTLTPQNAKERGYYFIDDVFYNSAVSSQDILQLLQEFHYKLGKPSEKNSVDSYFGFYAPKRKSTM